ncbi:MAG: DUF1360 domain-containing protein [Aggregatilineales bacterium]
MRKLLIVTLATWRLSQLIAREAGPGDIIKDFREQYPMGGLTTCPKCLSVWAAFTLWIAYDNPTSRPLVEMLAASGGALLLHRQTGGDHLD